MRTLRSPLTSAVALAVCCNAAVQAQDIPVLEEVIVTAQKRSQSVQDIPLAITAMSSDMLDERGITDMASMVSSVPGMHFGQAGANTRLTIRGIGTEQTTVIGDPGVAFHVDGVYQSRSSAGNALFYDLQRVEVLRGVFNTPLLDDKLLMRVSGQWEQRDGYYENHTPGADDIQDVDGLDLRAQLASKTS